MLDYLKIKRSFEQEKQKKRKLVSMSKFLLGHLIPGRVTTY